MIRKPVKGFKGLYEVSECGKVFSLERVVKKRGKVLYTKKEKQMSYEKTKTGYYRVILCKNGKSRKIFVHRLVAEAFLPRNRKKHPVVNHKDGDKIHNHYKNLEWCSYSDNTKHAIEIGLFSPKFQESRISDDVRKAVKKYYVKGSSTRGCVATGKKFGIGKQTVLNIIKEKL